MYWCVRLPAHVSDVFVCACVCLCVCVCVFVCVSQSMHDHSLYFREPHSPQRVAPSCGRAAKHNQQVRVWHTTASCMEEEIPHQKGTTGGLTRQLISLLLHCKHTCTQVVPIHTHVCTNTHKHTHTTHTHTHTHTHTTHTACMYIHTYTIQMYVHVHTHTLAVDYCRY